MYRAPARSSGATGLLMLIFLLWGAIHMAGCTDTPSDLGFGEMPPMEDVEIALANAPKESLLDWLLRPRTIRLSPLTSLALAAAAVVVVALLPERTPTVPDPVPFAVTEILVEFSLEAPGATTVAVAGDFSGWESDFALEDADGDGIWTGRIPITPGLHKYMFVIDGTDWVTDPGAQRYADDGFGNRNAILAVAPPASL